MKQFVDFFQALIFVDISWKIDPGCQHWQAQSVINKTNQTYSIIFLLSYKSDYFGTNFLGEQLATSRLV